MITSYKNELKDAMGKNSHEFIELESLHITCFPPSYTEGCDVYFVEDCCSQKCGEDCVNDLINEFQFEKCECLFEEDDFIRSVFKSKEFGIIICLVQDFDLFRKVFNDREYLGLLDIIEPEGIVPLRNLLRSWYVEGYRVGKNE